MSRNKNRNEQKSTKIRYNKEDIYPSEEGIIKGGVAARIAKINQSVDKHLNSKTVLTQVDKMNQLSDINVAKGSVAARIAAINKKFKA